MVRVVVSVIFGLDMWIILMYYYIRIISSMLTSINHQSWLFFLPLAQQASLLKDDLLDPVDDLLDDEELMALVRQCLATRYPQSARTGRPGMAPDRLLRSCVLKHLKGWSFRELERELRCNLIYRRFTHFDAEVIPRPTASVACLPCSVPRSPGRFIGGS